jgi:hypothetical protein
VRYVFSSDGIPLQSNSNWLTFQSSLIMAKNPRLQADFRKSRPFVTIGSSEMEQNMLFQQSAPWNVNPDLVGSPLGH